MPVLGMYHWYSFPFLSFEGQREVQTNGPPVLKQPRSEAMEWKAEQLTKNGLLSAGQKYCSLE